MSWPIFAIVQLALTTLGVIVAFTLRNLELRRQNAELTQAAASIEAERDALRDAGPQVDESKVEELDAEIKRLQDELEEARNAGTDSSQSDEELTELLRQFTRDSRDMMECIYNLEEENRSLREQLGQSDPAVESIEDVLNLPELEDVTPAAAAESAEAPPESSEPETEAADGDRT